MYRQLMQTYAKLGNRSMVKKAYGKCRKSIVDELGYALNRETELLAGAFVLNVPN